MDAAVDVCLWIYNLSTNINRYFFRREIIRWFRYLDYFYIRSLQVSRKKVVEQNAVLMEYQEKKIILKMKCTAK